MHTVRADKTLAIKATQKMEMVIILKRILLKKVTVTWVGSGWLSTQSNGSKGRRTSKINNA